MDLFAWRKGEVFAQHCRTLTQSAAFLLTIILFIILIKYTNSDLTDTNCNLLLFSYLYDVIACE